ncbi:hypothetical protein ACFQ6Q_04265 [Streptomyces sp. NPDC056437]|uniref:hypothetical protein n=1 Tax=Streptomyces sp. NPDC056437 TaxID=3345816 RepID=UPI0036B12FFB
MTASTLVSPLLLAEALADARDQLAAAEATDIRDHAAVVASQETLARTLRRVLWTLNAEGVS